MMFFKKSAVNDKSWGDLHPKFWPDDENWQTARQRLWEYFQTTADEQTKSPLATGHFLPYLKEYVAPRRNAETNCFSFACGLIADGVTIEPYFLAYAGIDRLLEDEPYRLSVHSNDHPFQIGFTQALDDMQAFGNSLTDLGFTRHGDRRHKPVIAMLKKNPQDPQDKDYHFLKVLTGFRDNAPRIALLERTKIAGSAEYHDSPQSYFKSEAYFLKTHHGYGAATAYFTPENLTGLTLSGARTDHKRNGRLIGYDYIAKASYTPSYPPVCAVA